MECPLQQSDHRIDLKQALDKVRESYRIQKIMVEGGASIITSLLSSPECIVDYVIITIAPLWVSFFTPFDRKLF